LKETTTMAGFGRFKLTDALPNAPAEIETSSPQSAAPGNTPGAKGRGRAKKKSGAKGAAGEQLRESRESSQAKNSEGSNRDRMVDIGRGNQQAGRQRAK
jgi:hypothetical protein